MVNVVQGLKDALVGSGRWDSFVSACGRIEKDGIYGAARINRAIDDMCPDLSEFKSRIGRRAGSKDKVERKSRKPPCSGFAMLEWVMENYERKDSVKERDAPSRAAWSLINACWRDDEVFTDTVLKEYIKQKLKNDSAEDANESGKIDGHREYDILSEMAKAIGVEETSG